MKNKESTFQVQAFSISDKGRRSNNEDFVAFFEPPDSQERTASGCIYIVADGIGGVSRGERASRYASKKVLYEYLQHPEIEPAERLKRVITQANREIFDYAEENGIRMATTMAVAVILDNSLIVANVGDCRVYLFRGNQVHQITHDHTVIGELVSQGELSESDAQASRIRNRLTRSVGGEKEVLVDIFDSIQLQPNDRILLCTDGLTRYASKHDLMVMVMQGSSREITNRLVDFANQQGGADNISVIFVLYKSTVDSNIPELSLHPRPMLADEDNSADETATEVPGGQISGRGILDYDDEEATELPRSSREDVTELEAPRTRRETQKSEEMVARHDAMENARKERAEREAAEKAAKEKAEREAMRKMSREKMEREDRRDQLTKRFKISIAYPKLLSKRFESPFLLQVYLPEERSQVARNIKSKFQEQKTSEHMQSSSVKLKQKIKVRLFSPAFDFSEPVIKLIDKAVNDFTLLGMPKDNCEPGLHKVLISISDGDTGQEFESLTITAQVVDFAFDHVSRPLLSRVSAVVLGISSFAMFILTFLEQIDKTVGLTSGTAAGVLALTVYAGFYNLYQRVRPSTP